MYNSSCMKLLVTAVLLISTSISHSVPVNLDYNPTSMTDHDAHPFGSEDRSERVLGGDGFSDNEEDEFHHAILNESSNAPCNEISEDYCSRCCEIEGFSKAIWTLAHYCRCT